MSTKLMTLRRMMRKGTEWIRINHLFPTTVDGNVVIEAGARMLVRISRVERDGLNVTCQLRDGTPIHSWLAWPEPGKVVIGPGRKVTIYLDDEHKRILLEYLAP